MHLNRVELSEPVECFPASSLFRVRNDFGVKGATVPGVIVHYLLMIVASATQLAHRSSRA